MFDIHKLGSVTVIGQGRIVAGLDINDVDAYIAETRCAPVADAHMQLAVEATSTYSAVGISEMTDDEINDLIGRAIHGGSITYPVLGEV